MNEEHREAIELYPIAPTYCTGVQKIELVEGNAHASFYLTQPDGVGGTQDILVARLIFPIEALTNARNLTQAVLEAAVHAKPKGGKGRMHA